MSPTEIPDAARAARPWAQELTIGPPRGVSDDECGSVEALVEHVAGEGPFPDRIHVPLRLDDGELELLAAGEPVWLTVCAPQLVPFALSVGRTV